MLLYEKAGKATAVLKHAVKTQEGMFIHNLRCRQMISYSLKRNFI
jgi:hypothetical protein